MALIGLTAAIGFAWAVLVLLASFVLGLVLWAPMGGWQLSRQLGQLRSGLQEPRGVLSDGALVAVATGLVLVPGLVTTVFGLLLLAPPIRAAARPGLTAIAVRGLLRRVPLTGAATPVSSATSSTARLSTSSMVSRRPCRRRWSRSTNWTNSMISMVSIDSTALLASTVSETCVPRRATARRRVPGSWPARPRSFAV